MPARNHSDQRVAISSMEPLILMSASSAEIDPATLADGTDGNDVLIALSPDQLLDGAGGHDILVGLAGDNVLKGGGGHDLLISVRGDNVIDGGSGQDTLAYWSGERADFQIVDKGYGIVEITSAHSTDLVTNVEQIQFKDGTYAVESLLGDAEISSNPAPDEPETASYESEPYETEPESEPYESQPEPEPYLPPPTNEPPQAMDDEFKTPQGVSVWGDVLVNDQDADGDDLTVSLKSGPEHGYLTLNADGNFDYIPKDGFVGKDVFTYEVSDGKGGIDHAEVCIWVEGPDTPDGPDLMAVEDKFSGPAYQTLFGNVIVNDLPNFDVTVELKEDVSFGTLNLYADGSFDYAPDAGFEGIDSFQYTLLDSQGRMSMATATIHIGDGPDDGKDGDNGDPGDPDDASGSDKSGSGKSGSGKSGSGKSGSGKSGSGKSGSGKSGSGKSGSGKSGSGKSGSGKSGSGKSGSGKSGSGKSGSGKSGSGKPEVDPHPQNRRPEAWDDSFKTPADVALWGSVVNNDSDPDGDALTVSLKSGPQGGYLTLNADGSFDYIPKWGWVGKDSFQYTLSDGKGGTDHGTVTIWVEGDGTPDDGDDDDSRKSGSGKSGSGKSGSGKSGSGKSGSGKSGSGKSGSGKSGSGKSGSGKSGSGKSGSGKSGSGKSGSGKSGSGKSGSGKSGSGKSGSGKSGSRSGKY